MQLNGQTHSFVFVFIFGEEVSFFVKTFIKLDLFFLICTFLKYENLYFNFVLIKSFALQNLTSPHLMVIYFYLHDLFAFNYNRRS